MKTYQKSLAAIGLFFAVFFGLYLLLSLAGMMFGNSYTQSIGCIPWFLIYTLFGVVIAGMITDEFIEN
jgi:hypothetical protein